VHLNITLVINQLNTQIIVYNNFIICLYMFRALCAHHQAVKIVLYSIILVINQLNAQIIGL